MRFFLILFLPAVVFAKPVDTESLTFRDLEVMEKTASDFNPESVDRDLHLGAMWTCHHRTRIPHAQEYSTPMRFEKMGGRLKRWDPAGLFTEVIFENEKLVRGFGFIDQLTPPFMWSEKSAKMQTGYMVFPHKEVIRKLPSGELLIRLHFYDFQNPSPQGYMLCTLPDVVS